MCIILGHQKAENSSGCSQTLLRLVRQLSGLIIAEFTLGWESGMPSSDPLLMRRCFHSRYELTVTCQGGGRFSLLPHRTASGQDVLNMLQVQLQNWDTN